jgi:hypothetical protein
VRFFSGWLVDNVQKLTLYIDFVTHFFADFMSFNSFLVEDLGFSIYKVMSAEYFTFFFLLCMALFIYFFLPNCSGFDDQHCNEKAEK